MDVQIRKGELRRSSAFPVRILRLALMGWLIAASAQAAPALWRVHGPKGAVITLIGTAPAARIDGAWRTAEFDQALAGADDIWFEAPRSPGPVTFVRLFGVVAGKGFLPRGESLSGLLSPEGRERLKRLSLRLSLDPQKIETYQPWWADLSLALAFRDHLKGQDRDGVERYVMAHAPRAARMHSFETLIRDLEALVASPRSEQIADLEYGMRRREMGLEALEPDMEAWMAGDAARMGREIIAPFRARAPQSFGPFVTQRHDLWAAQLERLAMGQRKVLVVVAVSNLVGPDSLPAQLRRRGLMVEGP